LFAVAAWGINRFCQADTIYATTGTLPKIGSNNVRPLFFPFSFRGMGLVARMRECMAARRSDWLVWGGGSNFHSEKDLDFHCRRLDSAPRATAFAVGISVGPFYDAGAEAACGRFFKRLAFVGVRDQMSLERVQKIAPQANVQLTFDLAPLLPLVAGIRDFRTDTPRAGLGVNLCNHDRFVGEGTRRETARLALVADALCAAAKEQLIDRVVLIDFNGHPIYGDHELHCELAERLRDRVPVEHVGYLDDPVEVMRRVASLRAMLAMRLHSAVFAFCTQTPTLLLCYHEKCYEWGKIAHLPADYCVDPSKISAADLKNRIGRLYGPQAPVPGLSLEIARDRAMSNWTWLTEEKSI
jgi:polysaccharide pyruvyl transferase WcaK-like protein